MDDTLKTARFSSLQLIREQINRVTTVAPNKVIKKDVSLRVEQSSNSI